MGVSSSLETSDNHAALRIVLGVVFVGSIGVVIGAVLIALSRLVRRTGRDIPPEEPSAPEGEHEEHDGE